MVKISPSVLASDLSNLASEVAEIEKAGAEMVHLDVMDGVFVPNMSFGMPVIECLRKKSGMFFDVHLMIVKPENYAKRFIDAGADLVTFHYEASENPAKLLDEIHAVLAGRHSGNGIDPEWNPGKHTNYHHQRQRCTQHSLSHRISLLTARFMF